MFGGVCSFKAVNGFSWSDSGSDDTRKQRKHRQTGGSCLLLGIVRDILRFQRAVASSSGGEPASSCITLSWMVSIGRRFRLHRRLSVPEASSGVSSSTARWVCASSSKLLMLPGHRMLSEGDWGRTTTTGRHRHSRSWPAGSAAGTRRR